ncbi:TlpA family protein disulfide reductase [Gracilimonas sediminicola]|uniref:TlpA family protein disulfide reductase n=1 Tax=Gracilimonas sediminicola TaxID=2952158 RepID=A0A9X2RG57_9BACT|nr:TlpA disulfide reductase family protein [Gracilimonas sediminicola]MCP9292990.1 TlpA family protein disulfide reductase [Gracilimonas sediminicola]
MKNIAGLFLLLIVFQSFAAAQIPKEGTWKGTIIYSNAEIPFQFEVEYPKDSESPVLTFINGEDRASLEATVRNDSLIIPMFGFDITLKMKQGSDSMEGRLFKHYRNQSYSFRAEYGLPRYEMAEEENPIVVGNRWDMTVNMGRSSEYPAVGLFEQNGNRVTGTIMTEVSDYRFFEGKVEGNSIEMSTFDGVHSFLLRGTYNESEERWSGELVLDNGYSRPWIATRDDSAELPDPFEMVDLTGKNIRPDLERLAVLAEQKINPEEYKGKVLIVQLMGTWCSNSQDQTRYLAEWVGENPGKEVEILAVNFEANYSPEYGLGRIQTYKNRLDVPYKMILGGRLSKSKAAEAFSFMDEIVAFPTLVFIDKDGYARYVHSYFTGPATGSYYEEFDQRFNAIVEELSR